MVFIPWIHALFVSVFIRINVFIIIIIIYYYYYYYYYQFYYYYSLYIYYSIIFNQFFLSKVYIKFIVYQIFI